jgi:hypothetical protein
LADGTSHESPADAFGRLPQLVHGEIHYRVAAGSPILSPSSPSRPPWLGVAPTKAGTVVCFAGLFSDPIIAAI